jgi:hypothetical protein
LFPVPNVGWVHIIYRRVCMDVAGRY